jgi:hypothetical protein
MYYRCKAIPGFSPSAQICEFFHFVRISGAKNFLRHLTAMVWSFEHRGPLKSGLGFGGCRAMNYYLGSSHFPAQADYGRPCLQEARWWARFYKSTSIINSLNFELPIPLIF